MAGERPKKKSKVERAPAVKPAAKRSVDARNLRIVLTLTALMAAAIYAMEIVNAVAMIGLIALVGLLYWRSPEGEAQPRRILGAGAVLLLAGLGVVGIGPHEIGIGLTMLALLLMAFGIHTFGRLGPEETAPEG